MSQENFEDKNIQKKKLKILSLLALCLIIVGGFFHYITTKPSPVYTEPLPDRPIEQAEVIVDKTERHVFMSENPYYAIDEKNIYYQDETLEITDPNSFKIITLYDNGALDDASRYPVYSYDNKNYYKNAEVIGKRSDTNIRVFADRYILVGDQLMGSNSSSKGIHSSKIENPDSLKYLGATFFVDNKKVYSTKWPDNCLGYECLSMRLFINSISPKDFKVVMTDGDNSDLINTEKYGGYNYYKNSDIYIPLEQSPRYIIVGSEVYAFVYLTDGQEVVARKIKDADADTFVYVGDGYTKDKNNVYYVNVTNLFSSPVLIDAESDSFMIYYPNPEGKFNLGKDNGSVYYASKLLKGIDPKTMVIERGNTVIKDNDTVWFDLGNCDFGDFREGDFSEIETYEPPC